MMISFPNHVSTTLIAHPYLMYSARIDIDPRTGSKRFFLWLRVVRIRDYKVPAQDQVGRQAGMDMRWVVSVAFGHSGQLQGCSRGGYKNELASFRERYRPSVQVKTVWKPQEETRASACSREGADIIMVSLSNRFR